MSILAYYFGWPLGAVWPNLLASAIAAGVVWWRVRARMIAHHAELLVQQELHHRALEDRVTAAATAPAQPSPGGNPVKDLSSAEFERHLRAFMRANPAEFDQKLRQIARMRGGRPVGGDRM